MPTLQPGVAPWQQQESVLIGEVHLFPKLIAINKDVFFCLTHNNLTGCNDKMQFPVLLIHFTARKTKLLSRWKLSHYCAPTVGPSVSMWKLPYQEGLLLLPRSSDLTLMHA